MTTQIYALMNGTGCKNLMANIAESFANLRIIAKFKICETQQFCCRELAEFVGWQI